MKIKNKFNQCFLILLFALVVTNIPGQELQNRSSEAGKIVKIGVLAYRGEDECLAVMVAQSLFNITAEHPAAIDADIAGWTIPSQYQAVRLLLQDLQVSPYEDNGEISLIDFLKLYWYWFLIALLAVLGLVIVVIYIFGLNTMLKEARTRLEEKVEERTAEFKRTNVDLKAEIEEHKQKEVLLSEAHNIINRSPAVAFLWKNEEGWPVEFVSQNIEKLSGYSTHEFLDSKISYIEIIHKDDLERVGGEVASFSKKKGLQTFAHEPYRIITKNGDIKWVDDVTFIRRDANGIITHYEGIVYDVTDRKQAENELKQIHERLTNTLENMTDGFVSLDKNWIYTYVNKKAGEMFSRNPADLVGKNIWKEFSEGVGQPFYKNYYKAVETQKLIVFEDYYQPLNSWFENRVIPSDDGLAIFFQDITERKLAEMEIKRFSRIFEESLNEIYLFDTDTLKFIQINSAAQNNLGYTMEEFQKMTPLDLKPEHTPESFAKLVVPLREGKTNKIVFETVHQRKDQSLYDVEVHLQLLKDEDKELFAAIILDITERKITETKINQQTKELKSLNSLSNNISRTLSLEKIIDVTIDELLSNVQPDMVYFFLWEHDNLILKRVGPQSARSRLGDIPNHEAGECICGLAVSEKRALYSKDIFTDMRCTWDECKEAGVKSFAALPLLIGDEVLGIIGLASYDSRNFEEQSIFLETLINEVALNVHNAMLYEKILQHAEEMEIKVDMRTKELSQANIRLLELDRLKSMFIASMSHVLRTPLNSIIGFTGLLLRGISGKIDVEAREDLDIVYNSSKHLLSLINDVIDISKIEADKFDVHFEDVKLDGVIEEILSAVSKEAEKKKLEIKTELPEGLIIVSDRRRLLQCIFNLMSNAIKFTEKGVIKLKVEKTDVMLKITVSDSGVGIQKEDIPKLFHSFVRLDSPMKEVTLGTGLGLYLTKKIITGVFQGDITVESEYGMGSAFTLEIPLKQNMEHG